MVSPGGMRAVLAGNGFAAEEILEEAAEQDTEAVRLELQPAAPGPEVAGTEEDLPGSSAFVLLQALANWRPFRRASFLQKKLDKSF
uniref:Uncharacterized protein n=1 Tax=viral metagenome TaxID=1070528 RepID=A0A6M3M932_9ZZZZ